MNSPLAVTYLPAFTRLESQKITALIKSDSTLLAHSIYWEREGGQKSPKHDYVIHGCSLVKAGRYVTAKGLSINDRVWVDFIHDFL